MALETTLKASCPAHLIWDPKWETADRSSIRNIQLDRLRETVEHCYNKVPLYRTRMQERGLAPSDIRSLEDMRLLPFTTKADFRENYPFGMFAVAPRNLFAFIPRAERPASRRWLVTPAKTWTPGSTSLPEW